MSRLMAFRKIHAPQTPLASQIIELTSRIQDSQYLDCTARHCFCCITVLSPYCISPPFIRGESSVPYSMHLESSPKLTIHRFRPSSLLTGLNQLLWFQEILPSRLSKYSSISLVPKFYPGRIPTSFLDHSFSTSKLKSPTSYALICCRKLSFNS